MFILDIEKCQTIKLSLKNDVLFHLPNFEGTYEMSTVINGHPSWISSTNAIWSNPDHPTNWVIGKLEAIGTNFGYIHAYGMFFGPKKTDMWSFRYRIELTLNKMNKNDVIVECLFEKGERQKVY